MKRFFSIVSKNPKMSVITHLSVRKNNQLRAYQFRFGRFGSSVKSFFSKKSLLFLFMFWIQVFLVFELDESEVAEKMYSAHLRRTPRPRPRSNGQWGAQELYPHLLTDWRTFFYICIYLNHITSCNPLLNTILIVMGHVISHVILSDLWQHPLPVCDRPLRDHSF